MEEPKVNQDSTHELCENWRIKGNEAYASKQLSKAEDYYTCGINSVCRDDEICDVCLTALALCYSNRAAVRMCFGRMREALEDCEKGVEIKPELLKIKIRAANCHLALGEIEAALRYFNGFLPHEGGLCLDRQLVIQASNGLQKAEKVKEYLNLCAELLGLRISSAAESVSEIIDKALLLSPYSEKLLEMKADALLMLLKYEEMIQLCEYSLDPADINSPSVSSDDSENKRSSFARLWRWNLMAKSYFYQGRLEESLSLFEKLEEESITQKFEGKTLEPSSALADTVRELLRHKAAATEAFQSGRHLEAVEHYYSALTTTLESPPFAAICFYNRAASYEALGKMREALEDCKKASEIDPLLREVHVIAANCHLALGEIEDALQCYKKSFPEESDMCLNRRLAIEVSNGLQRAQQAAEHLDRVGEHLRRRTSIDAEIALQIVDEALLISPYSEKLVEMKEEALLMQVAEHLDRVGEHLRRRTSIDAEIALQIVDEALLISPYSEKLVEMKAEALLMLLKYEEIIHLCEQSLDSSGKSSSGTADGKNSSGTADGSEKSKNCPSRLWRWNLMAKSYFYLGRFDEFLNCLEKLEKAESVPQKFGSKEVLGALAVTVRELLGHKAAGSEAFQLGKHSEAVDHYTAALTCSQVPRSFAALCYCSRAVALQSLGKIRAALEDYKKAVEINPDLHEIQVRAANCHLALGQIDDALQYFNNSLQQGTDLCLDRKLVIEASDGLLKAQQVLNFLDRCDELLGRRTSTDVERALQLINKALSISPYSEKFVEMKAEALLMLLKYEEMIELCDESLDAADKNYYSATTNSSKSITNHPARLWRWGLMAKAYFYLGRLKETVEFLQKLEQAESAAQKFRSKRPESLAAVRELLRHKEAGNEAFQSGRHVEAVEHYTCALSRNLESRPFSAICFHNRAVANQALGQIADAIADCSVAIALGRYYPKALSRRASLHEMIRDYSNAAIDLKRLISEKNCNQSGMLVTSTSGVIDLIEAHSRLSTVKEKAKEGIPLDMYLILGVESSCKRSAIKKAYHRAALRHHPDKASLVFPRSENGDNRVWKEIAEVVHNDAHVLFKMIGEAYCVLSDSAKRSKYDKEEAAGR